MSINNSFIRHKPLEEQKCCNCKLWVGPGIEIDHAHCKDPRSLHQTTSNQKEEIEND